jgi:hypothetical protein
MERSINARRDLAAYFIAQGKRDETAPATENAPLGGALFANLGCIACHTPPDYQSQDEFTRVHAFPCESQMAAACVYASILKILQRVMRPRACRIFV